MTEQSREGLERGFSSLGDIARFQGEMNQQKASYALERIEALERIKDEAGVIVGGYVQDAVNDAKSKIKDSILKERKLGKIRFGKTIDMSAISNINKDIDDLSRLARNSKVVDKFIGDGINIIDSNKYIRGPEKPGVKKLLMQTVMDPDKLSSMDYASLMGELDALIKNSSNMTDIVTDVIGKKGMSSVTITKANGEKKQINVPSNMAFDGKTMSLKFTPEGMAEVTDAFNSAKEQGYTGDLATVARDILNSASSTYLTAEGDPYFHAKNRAALAGARGEKEEKTESAYINVAATYLSQPDQISKLGFNKQINESMKAAGITYGEESGKLRIRVKTDIINPMTGEPIVETGPLIDKSDPKSFTVIKAFLQKHLPVGLVKRFDESAAYGLTGKKVSEEEPQGYFWDEIWKATKAGKGAGPLGPVPENRQPTSGKEKIDW